LEHYVAGVVESEGGIKQSLEFLKLQAIISRTYAICNSLKHLKTDGYNYCDNVHCQVYRGRCSNSMIMMATSQTSGDVIIDKNNRPISAAFHSNCGGQTINSEDVWSIVTTYLKSVKDTFCIKQSQAKWEMKIASKEWLDYLSKKFAYPVTDSTMKAKATTFVQTTRKVNFCDKPLIPLKTLRLDWKMKSAFFSVENKGDSLLIKGKGYGHGVGLCQEGSMRMVDLGWTYKDIIKFYYYGVTIVNISDLKAP
jgi:stage II sporulation protein D